MDPGKTGDVGNGSYKTGDVDNVSQKNRRCGKWILEKEEMWLMYPRKTDMDNGFYKNRGCG